MGAVSGANRTIIDTEPRVKLDPGLDRGLVKAIHDTYEASSLASGSTIKMGGKIPKGAYVVGMLLTHDALGSGVTLDVGDSEEAARYIDGQTATDAGGTSVPLVDGHGYKVDLSESDSPDDQVIITTGGNTANGDIKLTTFFVNL